jgi:hypothetical protein
VSVAEAEEILMRARRREAAQAGRTVRRRVDLANLDTPEVTPAELYAEFLNRPGRFYVATIKIPLDDKALGEKIATTTTFKATTTNCSTSSRCCARYAFGQHCRINLTPAEPNVAERGSPAPRCARFARASRRFASAPTRRAAGHARGALRGARDARQGRGPQRVHAPAGQRPLYARGRPPMVPGVDPRWQGIAPPDRECTREELVEMLPGQTPRRGGRGARQAPEAIGGL